MKKVFLPLILLSLLVSTCTKNPSGPTVSKSSLVYLPLWSKILILDSSKDQIVDSMNFDFYINDINLSPNQKILYLQKTYPDTGVIVEIDINSRKIIYEGRNSSLFISPDGKYLISTSKGLRLINPKTHAIVYENQVEVIGKPTFNSALPVFYIATRDNSILCFDYERLQIIRTLKAISEKNFRR